MGFPTAVIYLITMFCFMPFPFIGWFDGQARLLHEDDPMIGTFPYHKVCMMFIVLCMPCFLNNETLAW